MKKWTGKSKFFRFLYQQIVLRFTGQVREPYIIRIDKIFKDEETNEVSVAFHIANKRVSQVMTVADFVRSDMIYLINPHMVFDMGQEYGAHSAQHSIVKKEQPDLKRKCYAGLKRVFVDV